MAIVSESRSEDETKLQAIVEQFAAACRRGARPTIDEYVNGGSENPTLLQELVHVELECRLEAGENARVEDYLKKYPSLNGSSTTLFELIATEYRCRRRTETDLPFDEYERRFPQHHQELTSYLESAPPRTSICSKPPLGTERTQLLELPNTQVIQPKPTDKPHTMSQSRSTDGPHGGAQEPAPTVRTNVPGYDILSELGRGGMGVVYKARQTSLKRLVALKMILSGSHAGANDLVRFRSEAEAVAQIQNPNIVQIYDVGEHEGFPYFSLEFIDGGTLSHKIHKGPMDAGEAAQMMRLLALAIEAAHQKRIVHRDLKPDNVLLTKDGTPKITDFGLAKQLENATQHTQSGTVMGTPGYMAPEQALGRTREIGPGSDIYSLGAIFYEMLTGRPPFEGETPVDTMLLVVSQEPTSPSRLVASVPRDLETICLKCLQKEPRHRYETAKELADELDRFLNNQPILARRVGMIGRTWRWCRRNPVVAALSVQAVFAMAALGYVAWNKYMAPPTPAQTHTINSGSEFADESSVPVAPDDPFQPQLVALDKSLAEANVSDKDREEIERKLGDIIQKKDPAPSDAQKKWAEALKTITLLKSTDAGRRNQAIQSAKQQLIDDASPARPAKLCEALTECAKKDPALLNEARMVLKVALNKEGSSISPADREKIKSYQKTLLSDYARREALARNGNWTELLEQTKDDAESKDGWVLAARAEAILERAAGARLPDDEHRQANDAAFNKDATDAGGYAHYVRGLVSDSYDQSEVAAEELMKAYTGDKIDPAVQVAARENQAAKILAKAARKLRGSADPSKPLADPYSKDAAFKAYPWLQTAYRISTAKGGKPDANLLANLVFASWQQTDRNAATIEKLLAEIPDKDVPPEDKLPLLLIKAQATKDDPKRQPVALQSFAEIIQQLRTAATKDGDRIDEITKQVSDAVIDPGIALGVKLGVAANSAPVQRQALADLYLAKGRLIKKELPTVEVYEQTWSTFDHAMQLLDPNDKRRAECIVQRAFAAMNLPDKKTDLAQLAGDAAAAEKLDAEYGGSHFLLGYVRYVEAGRASNDQARIKLNEAALAAFSKAIALLQKYKDPDRELYSYFQWRSNVYVRLSRLEDKQAKTYLEQAASDLSAAIDRGPSEPDKVQRARGLVLEELYAITGRTPPLEDAIKAYEQAWRRNRKVAGYQVALGRSRYKLLYHEASQPRGGAETLRKEAIAQLATVIAGRGFAEKPIDLAKARTEATYWRGRLHELGKSHAEAEKDFQAIIAMGDKPEAQQWLALAQGGAAESALVRARAQAEKNAEDPEVKTLLDSVRANAERLAKDPAQAGAAARLKAQASLIEKKPADAMKVYLEELEREKQDPKGIDVRFAAAMLDLYHISEWRNDLRDAKVPGTDPEVWARTVDQILQKAIERQTDLSDVYGYAGLAHSEAIGPDDAEAKKHRQLAIDDLRKAAELSKANEGRGWFWRFQLAKQLESSTDEAGKAEQRKEALRWAKEAAQHAPETNRREINKFISDLSK